MKYILILFFSFSFANKKIYTDYKIEDGRFIVKEGGNSIANIPLEEISSVTLEIEGLIRVPKNASPETTSAIHIMNSDAKINKAKRFIIVKNKKVQISYTDLFDIMKQQNEILLKQKPTPLTKAQRETLESLQKEVQEEAKKRAADISNIQKFPSLYKTFNYSKTDLIQNAVDSAVKAGSAPWFVLLDGNAHLLGNASNTSVALYHIRGNTAGSSILQLVTPNRDLLCNTPQSPINSSQSQVRLDSNYALTSLISVNLTQNVIAVNTQNNNALCENTVIFKNSFETGAQ